MEQKEFYVIEYGVRAIKYLGATYDRYIKVDNIHFAEKFDSLDKASHHLNIYDKGRIKKIIATYEIYDN